MFSSEEVKYQCGQCGQEFSNRGCLAKHLTAVHNRVKIPCRYCGKQFSTKRDAVRHQRAVHEGVKYPCGICDHQATTKKSLAEHEGLGKKFERKKVRIAEKVELFSGRTFCLQIFWVHMEPDVLQRWQTTHFKAYSK